ncbi:MAG: nucleoside deaminase [Candidatus Micrarchaeota archaeon]|nr:nucleoside deaminase [Candidatus Micrarchaeota archaeon]
MKYIRLANSLGKMALDRNDYPCGCVVVRGNKIISKGRSQEVDKHDVTAHAETTAISRACKKLKTRTLRNCTLYTNIEPCLMCAQAILYARINKVVYGTEHGEYGKKRTFDILKRNGIGKQVEVMGGIEREKAKQMLNKFLGS